MNFDELKNAWANDASTDERLPGIALTEASTTLSRIRKNMKREFFTQVLAYLLIILLFLFSSKTILSIFVIIVLMQSAYYFFKFYFFYKSTGRYDLSLRKNLRRIVYELELNMEIYKTYSYCAAPLLTLAGIILIGGSSLTQGIAGTLGSTPHVHMHFLIWIFLVLLIGQLITAFLLNLHIRLQYGRYLSALKRIVEELEMEET